MTQYDNVIERQRLLIKAEEWAKGIKCIHLHSTTSMHYDNEDTKKEIEVNGPVTDTEYYNGIVKRTRGDKLIHVFGTELFGDELIDEYIRV